MATMWTPIVKVQEGHVTLDVLLQDSNSSPQNAITKLTPPPFFLHPRPGTGNGGLRKRSGPVTFVSPDAATNWAVVMSFYEGAGPRGRGGAQRGQSLTSCRGTRLDEPWERGHVKHALRNEALFFLGIFLPLLFS